MQKGESDVFDLFSEIYTSAAQEEFSLQEYLLACRDDKSLYATAQERMVEVRCFEPRDISRDPEQVLENGQDSADNGCRDHSIADGQSALNPDHLPVVSLGGKKIKRSNQTKGE